MSKSLLGPTSPQQRCAIYTRKSVTLGLDQEFNSLETQRSICSAYIISQGHKGWIEIPKHFDDAGRSGATLDRPALQGLLADIEAGLVDVVLVYKLDRITRTLLDFVRLMDFFERFEVAFVSITQNFDTADSMGRLILNVLLTFAQFEREILADRIRDKKRMIKQSGYWAGGTPPLGYVLRKHLLVIQKREAEIVRFIFESFIELGTYEAVYQECRRLDLRSKRWKADTGRWLGGRPVTKSSIYHILGNPVYRGLIKANDEVFIGMHEPIIDDELWQKVQVRRQERAVATRAGIQDFNLLTDILYDCFGRSMSLCHRRTTPEKTYSYYASNQNTWGRRHEKKPLRAQAIPLEEMVRAALKEMLSNRELIRSGLLSLGCYHERLDKLTGRAELAASRLNKLQPMELRRVFRAIFIRLELSNERLKAVVRWSEVENFLAWDGRGLFIPDEDNWGHCTKAHLLDIPCSAARCARRLCLPIEPRKPTGGRPSEGLVRLVSEARRAQALVDGNREKPVCEIARKMALKDSRFARILRLNYLAPDIVAAILDGEQPPELTRTALINANLPLDWALQRQILGFPPRPSPDGY